MSGKIGRVWQRKTTPQQRINIARRYRRGELVKIIADDHGISTSIVSRIAWARGASRRDEMHVRAG